MGLKALLVRSWNAQNDKPPSLTGVLFFTIPVTALLSIFDSENPYWVVLVQVVLISLLFVPVFRLSDRLLSMKKNKAPARKKAVPFLLYITLFSGMTFIFYYGSDHSPYGSIFLLIMISTNFL
ncbi:hypothetical protein IFT84_12385 [Rhizobium sp. CFBP 8762]|nr:hypothetical protein [Rhizobium sp. CFBP 8762]